MQKNLKLSPRVFGPFQVIAPVGLLDYKLDMPSDSLLYPPSSMYFILFFKKDNGHTCYTSFYIISSGFTKEVMLEPECILQRCHSMKFNNRATVEVLVQWKGATIMDNTWCLIGSYLKIFYTLQARHFEGEVCVMDQMSRRKCKREYEQNEEQQHIIDKEDDVLVLLFDQCQYNVVLISRTWSFKCTILMKH